MHSKTKNGETRANIQRGLFAAFEGWPGMFTFAIAQETTAKSTAKTVSIVVEDNPAVPIQVPANGMPDHHGLRKPPRARLHIRVLHLLHIIARLAK